MRWEAKNNGGAAPATPDPSGDVLHINLIDIAWEPLNCAGKDGVKFCLLMTVDITNAIAKTTVNRNRDCLLELWSPVSRYLCSQLNRAIEPTATNRLIIICRREKELVENTTFASVAILYT